MEDEAILAEILSVTCTQGENRICELVRHVPKCNQLLWNAALQLKEDIRDKLGDLRVGRVPGICRNFRLCDDCIHNEKCAWDLLQWLLQSHRCVVAVEADYNVLNSSAMVEALGEGAEGAGGGIDLPLEEDAETAATLDIPVRLLEKDGAVLVALGLTALNVSPQTADKLNDALRKNCTIAELAVGVNILTSCSSGVISTSFVQYLKKSNPTLRTLVLRGSLIMFSLEALVTLAQAICQVSTLADLTLDGGATRQKCALLLNELLQSQYLHSLNFQLWAGVCVVDKLPPSETSPVPSWVSALAKNKTLRKLDLEVSWYFRTDCDQLLDQLPTEHNLQSLTLRGFLQNACRIIRKRGLGGRISIHDYVVQLNDHLVPSVYETVKSIVVRSRSFWENPTALRSFFGFIVSWPHVTSLCVHLSTFDEEVFLSLAAYIKGVTCLKEIELRIDICVPDVEEGAVNADEDSQPLQSLYKFCDALSSNVGIAVIRLDTTIEIGDSGCPALADAALNRHVHALSVKGVKGTSIPVFLDRLLSRLGDNFNLLRLHIPVCVKPNDRMREAQDIVGRNCSIANRATRFVMKDLSPCCARAFEIVSEEPVLAHIARRRLGENAMAKILKAQNFLRDLDVHTYMRLAGVVQERVVCNRREDGCRQLDRLHYDSWLYVHRFLRLDDVVLP
ncbi:hypothetical protein MTO96_040067 [Rhipicephalus appendiculatus]